MSSYIGRININNTQYPIAQSLFGTCNTTANTATKVVTCADFDTLISGIVINVYFTYANTESSISLNVNSTGNKTVYVDNNSSILWDAGATKSFVYYNNQWRLINPTSVGTTYDAATTTAAGLMSAADKIKLNGITTGASTYAAGSGLSLSGTTFNHTNSITASSVGSSAATSGATLDVPYAKYDAQGHITEKGVHVHTIGSLAASAIISGTFATARIPNLPTSIITSGTFATARIPNLPASIITSGTFATARIPNLPASIITSGTFSTARLPVSTSVESNNNLPTGAAIQSYITGLGYEANQNAFTTVKVDTTDLVADSKTDTLTITAGNNITLTPTASSDSFSIAATNTTYGNATSSAAGLMSAADKQTLDGLVASGGEVNQNAFSKFFVKNGNGTPTQIDADAKQDSLILVATGSVSFSANTSTDTITITGTDTTYGAATTATAGLMSASDKIKLNGVPTSAFKTIKVGTTNLIADSAEDTLTITAGDNITLTPTASSDSFSIAATNTTYSNATTAAAGLMSAADKIKINKTIYQLDTLSTSSSVIYLPVHNGDTTYKVKSDVDLLSNVDICEAGIQERQNYTKETNVQDAGNVYFNIKQYNTDGTDIVNISFPLKDTNDYNKTVSIQKAYNNWASSEIVTKIPILNNSDGFLYDEHLLDSATIAAWNAIL